MIKSAAKDGNGKMDIKKRIFDKSQLDQSSGGKVSVYKIMHSLPY